MDPQWTFSKSKTHQLSPPPFYYKSTGISKVTAQLSRKRLNKIPCKFRNSSDMSLPTTDSFRKMLTIIKQLWRRMEFSQFSPLYVYGDFEGQIQSPLSKKRLVQILNNC